MPSAEDIEFTNIVIRNGLARQDDMDRCLEELKKRRDQGGAAVTV